ncbi:hypothetical protein C7974DRAFT_72879 [Boeremia exigua]|uniref:uncharacterized protein n=1 Tax=Boeremia exigua TaxID=749465 RepID=UPI001E8EA6BA|nr:uncharacterized protein C7974DRAFT_72879 [Boeremia exigua]KAH6614213.1 hypothetical protein C7974DRAFT_72879 [Boeremia exigua]
MIRSSRPDLDLINFSTLAAELGLPTTPSTSCSHLLFAQDLSLEDTDVLQPRAFLPSIPPSKTYSPLMVDDAPAPVLTPSRSSTSGDASESVLDSPAPLTSKPPRSLCNKFNHSSGSAIQQRLKTHAKENKDKDTVYTCSECPVSYRHPKNLRDHIQSKHQGKRYTCTINGCGEILAHKKNLKRHKEKKHGSFASQTVSPL